MADPAVTFLLENVTQIIKSYVSLMSEAKNELEQLKNDLSSLRAFLLEAAKKPKKEAQLREWERQIREAVYDAEDTIDSCLTQDAAEKAKRRPRLFSGAKRVSLAKQVKEVREHKVKPMFDKAKIDFANMQIADGSGTSVGQPSTRVKKDQFIRQLENIVGLEDQEEIIVNYLKEETKELDVISIIGMPGLGKTTLAWKIYQNPNIRREFPTCIWVYVSQEFTTRDLFQNILKEFTSEDMSKMTDQKMTDNVRDWLDDRKFLLVLDDVWTVDAWNAIKNVLPKSNRMGKVLITSRDKKVGTHAKGARPPHALRFLEPKESWELLQLEVFGNHEDCPEELRVIGEDIARQCDGLPLAIVVIGGILLDQLSATEEIIAIQNAWKNVAENVSTYVKNDPEQRISDIVALSYHKLPDDLRDCFLYLGVFPEDYEIPAWTLTRLWIAEGFIQPKEGKSLEETAEENLKDLISRNLVMVDKTNHMGEVKTCRVHDVIREFCNARAGISEQNLFREVKKSKDGFFEPSVTDIQRYRRLCIHFHLPEFLSKCLSEKQNDHRVRSFLCFYKDTILLDPKHIKTIPDTFNLLRVLDSKSIKFNEFPIKFTKLIHLRYITLSCDGLKDLPDAVTELWNLQTLVVDTTERILEIKASIWKMVQLRHLKTKAEIKLRAVQGEGKGGENLLTLSRISPECCTEKMFDRAPNLKRLGIRGRLADLPESKSLQKLDHLENLKLVNDLFYGSAAEDRLRGLPPCFPPKIKRLTLSATYLDWGHMSTLGMIGTLQVLKLKNNAFSGKYWKVTDGGFGSLQFLLIASADLGIWEASDNHFSNLKCLLLKNCRNLHKIPLGLGKGLQMLDIDGVSKSAVESARKIDDENKKTQGPKPARWGGFKLKIGPGCQ